MDENTPDPLDEVDPERLRRAFSEIAEILDDIPSRERLMDMMEEGGCRVSLSEIGLPESLEEESLALAPYVGRQMSLLRLGKLLVI